MKNNSVLLRLILVLVLTIAIMTYIINYIVKNQLQEILEEEIHDEMFVILQSMNWAIQPLIENNEDELIQQLIENISSYPIVGSLRIYSGKDTILYSNNPLENNQSIENACVSAIYEEHVPQKFYENFDERLYEAAILIRDTQAIIYISADFDYILQLWFGIINHFQAIFIGANGLLLLIIILYMYFYIGRPLLLFTKASKAIAQNNYDYKLEHKFNGEFYRLKLAYDDMRINIKEYIDKLAKAKLEAEKASEAKMIFLTNMSHEIRTPLNSILGFAELLEEQETDLEKKSELKIIHKSGKHLLTVINELLDFSKIESEQMEVESIIFNIRELIRDTSDFFYIQFNKNNIDYRFEIEEQVPLYFKGDANKIRQIIINLINNAIKFTKEGSITLHIDYIDPHLEIRVIDDGIGIEESKRISIFDAFSQSDNSIARKYGGTGLGLAICKKFSVMLGGDIKVESVLGKGSTFIVTVQAHPLESKTLLGRGILSKWLSADSELTDLVYETVLTLPLRKKQLFETFKQKNMQGFAEEIHALKGLTGNFQMNELYEILVNADKEMKKDSPNIMRINEMIDDIANIIDMVSKAATNHSRLDNTSEDHYDEIEKIETSLNTQKNTRNHTPKKDMQLLIAEDIRENQLLLVKILEPITKNIVFANNGREAMALLKQDHYDCMLLDIQMPEMSGEDVLNQIQVDKKNLVPIHIPYIIVVTAHATLEEKNRCLSMGANDYISKPIDKNKLRNMLLAIE